ncbi:MAG: RNA 2'-phosphotransferase, partial [Planctomycetaceae bacterium]|nr:RNA 2'-phosphotransferase [Planctomycetaceae bacterium]
VAYDTGGWFPIEELLGRSLGRNTTRIAMRLNIVARDDKGRFQISALVDSWGNLFDYFAIRAVSGHGIPWLDPFRFGCPVNEEDLQNYGCITHVTQVGRLTGVCRLGIIPGGSLTRDSRAGTDFGCYFYDDRRREIRGRVGQTGYDVTIVFDKQRLANSCQLFMAPNGVLFTRDVISPLTFFSIIEHVAGGREHQLLYHEMLMNERIEGHFRKAGDPSGSRMAAGGDSPKRSGAVFPPPGGLTGGRMASRVPQPGTDAFSDVMPGTGGPSIKELAQWKVGTLARYPCCHRIQP